MTDLDYTWEKIKGKNTRILYAAVGFTSGDTIGDTKNGIWRGVEAQTGAFVFTRIVKLNAGSAAPFNHQVSRVSLATDHKPGVSPAIYVVAVDGGKINTAYVYSSTALSGGVRDWSVLGATPGAKNPEAFSTNFVGTQGDYDLAITIDPNDPKIVYLGGQGGQTPVVVTTDGGKSWASPTTVRANNTLPHDDHHAFLFGPNGEVYDGNDGGLWKYLPKQQVWRNLNTNLNTIQVNAVATNDAPAAKVVLLEGSQDNGYAETGQQVFTQPGPWSAMAGSPGDGGLVRYNAQRTTAFAADKDTVLGGIIFQLSQEGDWVNIGQGLNNLGATSNKFPRYPVFAVSPDSPAHVMLSTNTGELYEGVPKQKGVFTWTKLTQPQQPAGVASPTALVYGDANTLYLARRDGTIEKGGFKNGQWTWTTIGTPKSGWGTAAITAIAVNPCNPNQVYITLDSALAGRQVFFKDGNAAWVNISGNLPAIPARSIVLDPLLATPTLYIGNEVGVYKGVGTPDPNNPKNLVWTWTAFGDPDKSGVRFPTVVVRDLQIYNPNGGAVETNGPRWLLAGTYGRGVYGIKLSDGPLGALNIQPGSITGIEGDAIGNTIVASFDDHDPNSVASNYTAVITWSDGSQSTGTVVGESCCHYNIVADHTFLEEDPHVTNPDGTTTYTPEPFTVTVTRITDGISGSATGAVTVFDGTLGGVRESLTCCTGTTFVGPLLVLSDQDPLATTDDFTSVIVAWDDGTVDNGTLEPLGNGNFNVVDEHSFEVGGDHLASVTIIDVGGSTLKYTAEVKADFPLHASGSFALSGVEDQRIDVGTLATFTDDDPNGDISQYSASLVVGGKSNPEGLTITPDPNGGFDVGGTITLGDETPGVIDVQFLITDVDGCRTTVDGTLTITDASLSASGGPPITLDEGQAYNGPLATFQDADAADTSASMGAVVHWGDGTPDTPGAVQPLGNGVYAVAGSHTFSDDGAYTITVMILDDGGARAQATTQATVSDLPLHAGVNSVILNTTEGGTVNLTVPFSDDAAGALLSEYSALVRWGDGSTSAGTISTDTNGNLTANATHIFTEEGTNLPVQVTIFDDGGSTVTVSGTATVADAALTASGTTVSATPGVPFTGPVATFTDGNPAALPGDFTATITWGDGSTSSSTTIQPTGAGSFTVYGTHTYTATGQGIPVTVLLTDDGGSTATAQGTATITATAGIPSISGISPTSGGPGTVVTLTGSGFSGTTQVSFGGTPSPSFSVLSDNQSTATAPAGLSGAASITVTNATGTSAPSTNALFSYPALSTGPLITSITPTVIQSGAAYFLTINGSGFTGTTEVLVGQLIVTSFFLTSDSQIELAENGGLPGTVDVRVITPQGESPITPADQLTFVAVLPAPTVTGVSPNNGSSAGGTSVTITGTNLTGVSQVFFGGLVAASFTVESSTTIQATTPASPTGTVDVTVVSPGGTSATSLADLYTFTATNPFLTPLAVTPSAAVTLDPAVSSVRPWYHHHAHHYQPEPERPHEDDGDGRGASDGAVSRADRDAFFAALYAG